MPGFLPLILAIAIAAMVVQAWGILKVATDRSGTHAGARALVAGAVVFFSALGAFAFAAIGDLVGIIAAVPFLLCAAAMADVYWKRLRTT